MRDRVESPLRPRAEVVAEPGDRPPAVPRPGRLALRPLTGWEEEYLARHAADQNTARLCNEVLARCLVAPGEDPGEARDAVRELLVAERDRELVTLRRLSLGPDVSARVSCPSCGETSEAEFSLDVLPLDFESPPRHVTVELDGVGEVVVRLPTAGDQEDLLDAGLETEAERRTWLIARSVERFGGRGGLDPEGARALDVGVRAELETAIERALPELELEMVVECSHCGAPIAAPFDVATFFFSS